MSSRAPQGRLLRLFPGDTEMAGRMRALDWEKTALGPPEGWPEDMQVAARFCLTAGIAVFLLLGAELTMLYNDAFIPFLGEAKHPRALARPGRECWSEIWDTVGPMAAGVYESGRAASPSDFPMFFRRRVPREEVYVRFTFGPIFDARGRRVIGIVCPCTETTEQVIGARRTETLRRLGIRSADARTVDAACAEAARVLGENPRDVAFAAIYAVRPAGSRAMLCARVVAGGEHHLPESVCEGEDDARWPLAEVLRTGRAAEHTDLVARGVRIPGVEWPEPAETAILLPIEATKGRLAAILVLGVSPRRPLDASYRTFLDLVGSHVATSISDAGAYEAERERAEKLAEIDRAKTTFFTNVSHELRTPLTLVLGPLEEALGALHGADQDALRGDLTTAHRNAARLLKLVNALLDFSRIEAGRMNARYEPTDLAPRTAELASMFHSALESAGLSLTVDCEPIGEPVYVDRDMWEKIVCNLLSNAFKFTFEGGVRVALAKVGDRVELSVADTGTGIAASDLPILFERFHRVEGARARTHEGSGIGLALVQDLAHLHGGEIRVKSVLGEGSTFTVSIPLGCDHLPKDRVADGSPPPSSPSSSAAAAFVDEALRWVPSAAVEAPAEPAPSARILVADDNADMRDYLGRLLRRRWAVEAVADGEAALAAVRRAPFDLVLTDVMMPILDGFGLLKALRADPALEAIPVVLLSARAGEESRLEALRTGADDYLVKPFSAAEVLARVELLLKKARVDTALRVSLAEQQALMREVHHRVKNNLEVVNGLLMLQSDFVSDDKLRAVLVETANRVHVIADIHRLLYAAPNVDQVDLQAFVQRLAGSLLTFYASAGARIRLDLHTAPAKVSLERALPLGLILNELFCNAFKHAFPGDRRGTVRVHVDADGLDFSDDGIGLPPSVDPERSPSLGLQLVCILVKQIGGTLSVERGPGTRFRVKLPPAVKMER